MEKRKHITPITFLAFPRPFELATDLPLEECLYRLSMLNQPKPRGFFGISPAQHIYEEHWLINEHTYDFDLQLRRRNSKSFSGYSVSTYIKGTLVIDKGLEKTVIRGQVCQSVTYLFIALPILMLFYVLWWFGISFLTFGIFALWPIALFGMGIMLTIWRVLQDRQIIFYTLRHSLDGYKLQ